MPPRNPGNLVTGFLAGFALALFGSIIAGAGLIVAAALYFAFRNSQPAFARGWGFGVLTVIAILLGLFAICTWQLYSSTKGTMGL
jgi:Na+/H+ antiporter NhaA